MSSGEEKDFAGQRKTRQGKSPLTCSAEEFARVFNQEANRFLETLDKVTNIYGADNYTPEIVDDTISVYKGEKSLVDIRRKIKIGA